MVARHDGDAVGAHATFRQAGHQPTETTERTMSHALARGAIARQPPDAVMVRYEPRHEVLRAAMNRVRVRPSGNPPRDEIFVHRVERCDFSTPSLLVGVFFGAAGGAVINHLVAICRNGIQPLATAPRFSPSLGMAQVAMAWTPWSR